MELLSPHWGLSDWVSAGMLKSLVFFGKECCVCFIKALKSLVLSFRIYVL